jgi:hypothetical protein
VVESFGTGSISKPVGWRVFPAKAELQSASGEFSMAYDGVPAFAGMTPSGNGRAPQITLLPEFSSHGVKVLYVRVKEGLFYFETGS